MKQVLQNFKTGELRVEEVPPPVVREGFVLVRNTHSLISPGTEGGTVKLGTRLEVAYSDQLRGHLDPEKNLIGILCDSNRYPGSTGMFADIC